jgi:RNA polymerase sigma factor for flagellar operon FliA
MIAPDLQELWIRYKQRQDRNARDQIITNYAYLVKITAGRVVANPPPSLEREDLISAGVVGLIKAVDQFDPDRNVKFETYAIALIRGAILEMLRKEDWVPRSVRERVKQLERCYAELERKIGRPAREDEVAEALNLDMDSFYVLLAETGRTHLISLDDVLMGEDGPEKVRLLDLIQEEGSSPSAEAELQAMKEILARSIDRLPDREKMVIALYYHEGLTFKEIGKVLEVSESRVYQLHTQAVVRLRNYLSNDAALFC